MLAENWLQIQSTIYGYYWVFQKTVFYCFR